MPVMATERVNRLRRVLYATALDPSLKFGSMEEQILTLARVFKERGGFFLPLFQTPLGPRLAAEFCADGLKAEWADLIQFNIGILGRLLQLIRRYKIELIHWNFYHPLNWYVWALTLLSPGLEHYRTDHNSRDLDARGLPVAPSTHRLEKLLKKILLVRYSRVLCVSEFVRDRVEREGPWSRVSSCLHFINTDRFRPDIAVRSRLRKDLHGENLFVVLVVAQLIRAKGVDVALRALRKVDERIALWIIGEGHEESNLGRLCEELGLGARVMFFGRQMDVSAYMQAADCLVVPSIWAEAAGLVVLEGLASGLPVVASAVGAIPEFVEDGGNGFLFPAGDDERLAERINRLAADPETCRQMGLRARSTAVEKFSIRKRLPEHLELYRVPGQG